MKKKSMQILSVLLGVVLCFSAAAEITASAKNYTKKRKPKWQEYYDSDSGFYAKSCAKVNGQLVLKEGSVVYLGHYPQDKNDSSWDEEDYDPIQWQVLSSRDGTAVLVSKYALDSIPYHNRKEEITWEDCALREWLNEEFYDMAFTSEEQDLIQENSIKSSRNPQYNYIDPGDDTVDLVTLMSAEEADGEFMDSDSERFCRPTDYAVSRGAYKSSIGGCWWWIRTPGYSRKDASSVNSDGSMDYDDAVVNGPKGCVRPVILIEIP